MTNSHKMLIRRITYIYAVVPLSKVFVSIPLLIPAVMRLYSLLDRSEQIGLDFNRIAIDSLIAIQFSKLLLFGAVSVCFWFHFTKFAQFVVLTGCRQMYLNLNVIFTSISSFIHLLPVVLCHEDFVSLREIFSMIGWECFTIINQIILAYYMCKAADKQLQNEIQFV